MREGPGFVSALPDDVYVIDTGFGRDRLDAAYLLYSAGRGVFIDSGHNAAVPRLLAALDVVGLPRSAVDWVIVTHVHLDHAGGVGELMAALPGARVLCHPRAARHIADPSALRAGAVQTYGESEVTRTYGVLRSVPIERIEHSHDGMVLNWAGRPLTLLDAPGHARHHHVAWDPWTRGWFSGDTFGVSYPEIHGPSRRFGLPSCTPVQFDPMAMRASVDRMLAFGPACVYPTHFGRVDDPADLALQLRRQLDAIELLSTRVRRLPSAHWPAKVRQGLQEVTVQALAEVGVTLPVEQALVLLETDLMLNTQGLLVWMAQQTKA